MTNRKQAQNEWWKSRSAVDDSEPIGDEDGDENLDPDAEWMPSEDSDWLNSWSFRDDERTSDERIGGLWSRYGDGMWGGDQPDPERDVALRIVRAQRVVQGFVNTFATGDRPYRVVFDPTSRTAGTDFKARLIGVSHRPLFDQTLTPEEAQTILTAMAVHESSHVAYGRKTAAAVEGHANPLAARLSNILDDFRIERRFAAEWPGYAGVFAPALAYVAKSALPEGVDLYDADRLAGLDMVSGAVRYTDHVAWTPDTIGERDWWADWALRGSAKDTPAHHLAAVNEGLAHLAEQTPPEAPQPEPDEGVPSPDSDDGDESDEPQTGSGASADDDDDEQDESASASPQSKAGDESDGDRDGTPSASGASGDDSEDGDEDGSGSAGADMTDEVREQVAREQADIDDSDEADGSAEQGNGQGDATGKGNSSTGQPQLPGCFAEAIAEAATGNGETSYMTDAAAQKLADQAAALTDDGAGEVYWRPSGIASSRRAVEDFTAAGGSIRAAFARSRTGHYGVRRSLRSGHVDNRSLPRLASDDFRLFSRRIEQSEGKYRVWLLVDCSGSMAGYPLQKASQVAAALAQATRQLPNVSLDVWGWSSGFKLGRGFGAVRVYAEGEPVQNVGYLMTVPKGGTPDRSVLEWAGKAIRRACLPGEQPVVILASDGSGSLIPTVVPAIRRTGVAVLNVALGRLAADWQDMMFGRGNYVMWAGSIQRTAPALGRIIGRMAAGHGTRVG